MKHPFKSLGFYVAVATAVLFASCKKDQSALNADTISAIQAAVIQTQAISLGGSPTTPGDSLYAVNACGQRGHKDSIAFSSLPSAATAYLTANYSGYTAVKAFSIKDQSGAITGYVAVINFNSNPVAVKFDANGNFVQVLEQREGRDLLTKGWHEGGCFEHRDGMHKDTIALTALPSSISAYFASNYASDTLVLASATRDGGYIVLSKNGSLYATVFNADGTFNNRIQLPAHPGKGNSIDESALPANISSYLSATYPGYVFDKAFSITVNGAVQGYCVVIESNSTRYGLQFDANGNFVRSKTIK